MDDLNYNNYCIVYGGEKKLENNHVIHLDCDDTYCGLPNKINKTFKYLNIHKEFSHVLKIDRTCIFKKIIPPELLRHVDYCGRKIHNFGNFASDYHFNRKCDPNSKWYNKLFHGKPINYCAGDGYFLSKRAINIIAQDKNYDNHIFEDYYVADTLREHEIFPMYFSIAKNYFYDPEHPW